jgi:RNA polymerase sigma factor (sigma-70 family)
MSQGELRAVLGYLRRVANPDGGGPGDAQLLDRWRSQRDPLAFEVLVWRHGAMVWNVCRRVLGRPQDVEDAFQATFLTFLRKADTIGQGRFLGSWLYKVAYRTAQTARVASARHTVYQELDANFPQASTEDGWDELGPVLDEEVNRLPEKYRRPFVLCYLEGKTTDEAARDLGCPRGTVGTRLAWARQRLRSRLTRRGLALSAAGLATLLAGKAAAASVPAPVVLCTVKAAAFSTAGQALAAGAISARAAALSQGVLQGMFLVKLKTVAVVLLAVGILGSGAGLLAQQALADRNTQTGEGKQPESAARLAAPTAGPASRAGLPARAEDGVPPNRDTRDRDDEENPVVAKEDKGPAAQGKDGKSEPLPISGTVVQVDQDGKALGLEVPSKVKGGAARKVEIKITDQTELVFSNVGPNEARLTEGYAADVRLEKDSTDVAARVHLSGHRNAKNAPHRVGKVVAVAAGGKGTILEKPAKGKPAEKIAIQFTDKTRVSFANVARDGAAMTVGYEGRVWLEKDSPDTAKAVTFFGTAEEKPAEGKDQKADRSGRVVGVSGDGQVLTVEVPPTKGGEPARTEIKLTAATRESYHGVAADGAKPVAGYLVQVWLAEGSQDTAVRVRFSRDDPRKSVDARILAVSADGGRLTVDVPSRVKGGQATRLEIQITARTELVFANVGPGGARLAEGYHVRGWLVEGSEDTADELTVSRSEKADGK